ERVLRHAGPSLFARSGSQVRQRLLAHRQGRDGKLRVTGIIELSEILLQGLGIVLAVVVPSAEPAEDISGPAALGIFREILLQQRLGAAALRRVRDGLVG